MFKLEVRRGKDDAPTYDTFEDADKAVIAFLRSCELAHFSAVLSKWEQESRSFKTLRIVRRYR